ncbi:Aminopeptidase N [Chitinophaga jiangningensis]|uniref:Aminopeptidase N n=1 Tax=Chitinophaga jiangningensis TaxID=1419482 RepID=A0A1M7CLN5_9BACT|nr:M1 family aminopeptidase [Chitinophaga jiangningensis]SHL68023.1 Aminopeptidase N [Chitinophaga jiangningensis]
MRLLIIIFCFLVPVQLFSQHQLNYQLHLQVNPETKRFTVEGNAAFITDATMADSLDIRLAKVEQLSRLQLEGGEGRLDSSNRKSGDVIYRWHFSKPLATGTPIRLSFAYERGSSPAFQYYLDSGFCWASGYGSAWYPQLQELATDGSTNTVRSTGSITITTPAPMMPVMASANITTAGNSYTYQYSQPDILSVYIGKYTREEIKGPRNFYTYRLSKEVDGKDICQKAASVLDFLSTQFGPLAIPNFSIIEYPDAVAERLGIGGASIFGGVVMPTAALQKFNYALFGHEIGHQWWGNKIRAKGEKGKAILTEAMAQYGSLQVVMQFDPVRARDYRMTGYPGYLKDQSGIGYLKNAAAGNDEPLVALSGANDHILADSKGFMALEFLSNTVGKQAFHQALRTIGERYATTGLTWEDFVNEVNKASGKPVDWVFQQWFERTGAPSWESQWQQQQNQLHLTIQQPDSLYNLALEVLITYENGKTSSQQISLRERDASFLLPVAGKVTAVAIDPAFKVLHWDAALKPNAIAQAKVVRVLNLRMAGKNNEAFALAKTYVEDSTTEDLYGVKYALLNHMGRIAALQNRPAEALQYYQQSLQCATKVPEQLAYTYYRIAQLAASTGDSVLLHSAAENAVAADKLNNGADGMEIKVRQWK